MKNILFFILILSPFSSNAASIKASECQTMNWEDKGRRDGLEGKKIDLLYSYIKTCDKAGSPFSADLYRKGREEGLYTFCSNKNAYDMGMNKVRIKKDTCAFNMFPDFQAFYDKGLNFKKVEKQKIALEKRIAHLSKTIEILNQAKAENKQLDIELKSLEFKPEMANTQIIKSTLVDNMNQPLMADPGSETSANSQKPLDLDAYPGDMQEERIPTSEPKKAN